MTASARVTLKTATSLDGKIALANGQSQWITGDEARRRSHRLRAEHDAVLIGAGTARADDPLLTARLDGYQLGQPLRVVADSLAGLPLDSQLARTATQEAPVLVVASDQRLQMGQAEALRKAGIRVSAVDGDRPNPVLCVEAVVKTLRALGREPHRGDDFRIMLEGGGVLAAAFLQAGLIDTICWFRAPLIIGGDGRPALAGFGLSTLSQAPRFRLDATERIGGDALDTYVLAKET